MPSTHELRPLGERDVWPLEPAQAWGAVALFVVALLGAVVLGVLESSGGERPAAVDRPPAEEIGLPVLDEFVPPPLPDAWLFPEERPPDLPPTDVDVL